MFDALAMCGLIGVLGKCCFHKDVILVVGEI